MVDKIIILLVMLFACTTLPPGPDPVKTDKEIYCLERCFNPYVNYPEDNILYKMGENMQIEMLEDCLTLDLEDADANFFWERLYKNQ